MKKLDLKKNWYWLSVMGAWGLGFLIVVVCYYTLHLPQKEMLLQVRRQADESRDMLVIAQRATRQDMRQEAQQQLLETEEAVNHFSVPRLHTTALVFEIGKIANDLELSEFASKNQPFRDIPTIRDSETVSEDWLKLEFNASFPEFAQFINRLERQTPTVFVERLTLRRSEDDRLDHDVKMDLSFIVTQDKNNSLAMADDSTDRTDQSSNR